MRRCIIVLTTALMLTGLAVSPTRAATPTPPDRIHGLRAATRAIVVTSGSWHTTHAVMRTWQRVGGRWRLVRGPMPVRIGRNGFSAHRHEGDGTTPAGDLRVRLRLRQPPRSRHAGVPLAPPDAGLLLVGPAGRLQPVGRGPALHSA